MRAYPKFSLTAFFVVASLGRSAGPASGPEPDHGYLELGFDRLAAFNFTAPDSDSAADAKANSQAGEAQIPPEVKGWNQKKAVITGFMLPTKLENGNATEFLLMANQMACCFGTVPKMNDWVVVHMPQGTQVIQDVPISFYGTFRVGAVYEDGYLTGIYAMDSERICPTKK